MEINPSTENTTLSRRIAAVERRMGIENAKNLGKVLLGMTSENMYTAADYDKAILSLAKRKLILRTKFLLCRKSEKKLLRLPRAYKFAKHTSLSGCSM